MTGSWRLDAGPNRGSRKITPPERSLNLPEVFARELEVGRVGDWRVRILRALADVGLMGSNCADSI
jgi:hypothetical protein